MVFFDTLIPKATTSGLRLGHRIQVAPAAGTQTDPSRTVLETPPLAVATKLPLIVDAPFKSGSWLAANALSNNADHRRTIAVVNGASRIAQRYAIDFVKLDPHGRAYSGDPSRNENWVGYGEPILAVADAIVERVFDGLPDNQPLTPPSIRIGLDTIAGNHLVLVLPNGERVLYGHLKPGSIAVKKGEHVKRGDILAALGNSGQSDAPHLHIHIADGASALGANGLTFAFRTFRVAGYAPSLQILEKPEGWNGPAPSGRDVRENELPTDLAVIEF
ncbi:M23 family metallopeptidase [Sphingopyxis sp.]|uniref:M23 family metallopeptidase n=1 Tax=Sphingopyxis sp. TaxID=1908224 RepID=UPI003458EAD1